MKYSKILQGKFISRPNRFIAHVLIDNKEEVVHVKNTGRCKELLTPEATVYLQDCQSPTRKTRYDLISVYKGDRLINMDSQIPNAVVKQWLENGGLFKNISLLKGEQTFGNSRFDFYVEHFDLDGNLTKAYIEVKGVTLENNNVALFPDAPTSRGVKHIKELIQAKKQGYQAYIIFVIQIKGIDYFTPNQKQDPDFAKTLKEAKDNGVTILAFDCNITKNTIDYNSMIEVKLEI